MPRSTSTITKRQLELRKTLWPDLSANDFWDHRVSKGFTPVPRALPLLLSIMDEMAPKALPVSKVFLDLWCRLWDEQFVRLKPREMALAAGFRGQRAERAWINRMKVLADLGFILITPNLESAYSHAAVLNPFSVIKRHREQRNSRLTEELFLALVARVSEVGAKDFSPASVAPSAVVPVNTPP